MVLSEAGKPAIEAVLAEVGAAKLKELAKNYYVKGYSKMNKPTLVQAVSAALRDPGRMEELLYIIDQPAFLLFKRAAGSRKPVKVKKALPEQCSLLEDLCYLVCDASQEDIMVTVPAEISEVFQQLERDGFPERKARCDLLDSYAMAAVHLYGAISQPDFADIFNRQNSQPTSVEELFPALLRHVAAGAPYCFWGRISSAVSSRRTTLRMCGICCANAAESPGIFRKRTSCCAMPTGTTMSARRRWTP